MVPTAASNRVKCGDNEHNAIKMVQTQENLLTSANEKQTMKSFSFFGYRRSTTKKIVLA